MCGIAGYWAPSALVGKAEAASILRTMGERIARRGPDDEGYHIDEALGLGLVHRRLAVADTSIMGRQPMWSPSGRFLMVFNGEIYNHLALRARLAQPWRGASDTETLLAAFDAWGIERALTESTGMFAFVAWDSQERCLVLGRDRLGEKPLYYGWQGRGEGAAFLFGSDLAALRSHPSFASEIDRDALAAFMRHNSVPGTESIFRGIYKLAPGTVRRFVAFDQIGLESCYWSAIKMIGRNTTSRFQGNIDEAVTELDLLLKRSVSEQMLADVPVGAFLSGGIDSSLITAITQAQSARPTKTFTLGFAEQGYSEASYARRIADHLGTEHTEFMMSASDAVALVPEMPVIYSEPFADSSQLATHLLARETRVHVTVALSGDGGDELFGGYNRYRVIENLWPLLSKVPLGVGKLVGRLILSIPATWLDRLVHAVHALDREMISEHRFSQMVYKMARVIQSQSIPSAYSSLISNWNNPESLVLGSREKAPGGVPTIPGLGALSSAEWMMAQDMVGYLPNDVLTKVDRASMGASLEVRAPFLDHRIVEFAWSLPSGFKLRAGQGKYPLRQLLSKYLPWELFERPKSGFGVPIGQWLAGPLQEWAEDLLDENRLREDGLLDTKQVREVWAHFKSGNHFTQHQLWAILMFQAWLHQSHKGARA